LANASQGSNLAAKPLELESNLRCARNGLGVNNPFLFLFFDGIVLQTMDRLFYRINTTVCGRCLLLSSTPIDSEKMEKELGPFDITLLDIYQLLEVFVALLSEQAWRHMGLRVYPGTSEVRKDLVKAHLAIDCIIVLVDKDLQLNYAEQMK
jgi:hypothetical protein